MDSVAQSTSVGSKNIAPGLAKEFRGHRKSLLLHFLFLIYRSLIRPFLATAALVLMGPLNRCRFTPTCGCYSEEALSHYGMLKGSYLSIIRICKCHPWSKADPVDPVPQQFTAPFPKWVQKVIPS